MTNLKTAAELKAIAKERSLDKYGVLIIANIIIIIINSNSFKKEILVYSNISYFSFYI